MNRDNGLINPELLQWVSENSHNGAMMPRKGFDPISGFIGTAILNALLSTSAASIGFGTLATFSQVLAGGIVAGGLFGISSALGGGASSSVADPAVTKNTYELETGPRRIVLGRARVGGVYALRTYESYYIHRLLLGCQGPIDGIEKYFVKNRDVTVDGDGFVSSPPYAWSTADSRGTKNYLRILTKPGNPNQVAFNSLLTAFPDNWTSDHRGRGILATHLRYASPGTTDPRFIKIWPSGAPDVDLLVRGPAAFDPREGGQSFADPDSWTFTNNGVLNVLALLTKPLEDGGQGRDIDEFDLTDIALSADSADTPVSSLSGSEALSICSGSYTTDTARGQVLAEVLQSTGTQIVQLQNGKKSIRLLDDNPTPTCTIRRQDIKSLPYSGTELVSDANQLVLKYLSPERYWQMAEIGISDKGWSKDADSITDTGKRETTLELKFCPQSGQAQRIGRRHFNRLRARQGSIVTGPAGYYVFGHRFATAQMDDLFGDGETEIVEIESPKIDFNAQEITLPVKYLEPLSTWDYTTDEATAPVALAGIQFSGDIAQPKTTGPVYVADYAGVPEMRFAWLAVPDVDGYEARYNTVTGTEPNIIYGSPQRMTEDNINLWAHEDGVTVGDTYQTRVRATTADGEVGQDSDDVTTTLAYDTTPPVEAKCFVSTPEVVYESNVTPISGAYQTWEYTYSCEDLNISQIDGADKRPYEETTISVDVYAYNAGTTSSPNWQWGDMPEGTITFANSTGQTTEVSYGPPPFP